MVDCRLKEQGKLFVLSAPSGSGKTTVLDSLMRLEPGVIRSISATTRSRRPGERPGRDYHFLGFKRFERGRRRGEFLESARILGHWYGTPRRPIERALRTGKNVFLSIDVQGARQIHGSGLPVVTIFLLPPSLEALRRRLKRRGTEAPAQILARLRLARRELKELTRYDYAVVNDRLKEAVACVRAILKAEGCRIEPGRGRAGIR